MELAPPSLPLVEWGLAMKMTSKPDLSIVGSGVAGGAMSQGRGDNALSGAEGLNGFVISDSETLDFIELIHRHSGIVLTPEKRNLISSRLQKRLKILGLASFGEYFDYLHYAPERDDEIIAMIDEITTNKTAFFREGHHFDFLTSKVLPRLVTSQWSTVNVWSAGCSTGEEPYTLAMVLAEYFGATQNFTILATDLSTQALQTAQRAVYSNELGGPIPLAMRQKYTMTGYRSQRGRFRIVPELRERVTFQQLNLIDRDWNVPAGLNIIFCRNVMIYFNRESRSGIISRFRRTLKSDGYLFIGHSETLGDLDHRFVQVQPTVYTHHK